MTANRLHSSAEHPHISNTHTRAHTHTHMHTHTHTHTKKYSIDLRRRLDVFVFILGQTVGSRGWKTNLEWRMVQYFSVSVTVLRSVSLSACLFVCLSVCPLKRRWCVCVCVCVFVPGMSSSLVQKINIHRINMGPQVAEVK